MAMYEGAARLRGQTALGVSVACTAAIVVLLALEIATPVVTYGALVLLVVVIAALLLDDRATVAIAALAVVSRVISSAAGGVDPTVAAVECVCIAVAAGTILYWRRAGTTTSDAEPAPVLAAAASAPAVPRFALDGQLTSREREVVTMAMQGLTAAQVAERLFISRRTVETHLERAYSKLGVRSKRELIASAFDEARVPRSR